MKKGETLKKIVLTPLQLHTMLIAIAWANAHRKATAHHSRVLKQVERKIEIALEDEE